jgi:hypothetical protein
LSRTSATRQGHHVLSTASSQANVARAKTLSSQELHIADGWTLRRSLPVSKPVVSRPSDNPGMKSSSSAPRPSSKPTDHTFWMAILVEVVAIAAAVLFAYEHAAS